MTTHWNLKSSEDRANKAVSKYRIKILSPAIGSMQNQMPRVNVTVAFQILKAKGYFGREENGKVDICFTILPSKRSIDDATCQNAFNTMILWCLLLAEHE